MNRHAHAGAWHEKYPQGDDMEPQLVGEDTHRMRRIHSRTTEYQQAKDKYANFVDWLKGYFDTIALVSGLGSQITFSIVVSSIVDPATVNYGWDGDVFTISQVHQLITTSWVAFTVAVGISIFAKIVFTDPIHQRNLEKNLKSRLFRFQLGTVLFLLNVLPPAAFTFMSLAVSAYVPPQGWMMVAISGIFTLFSFAMSLGFLGVGPSIPRLLREFY
jgi:hypothetical protein